MLHPLISDLFDALHACPEISNREIRTPETIKAFLRAHTTLTLHTCGEGFYAAHREVNASCGIALRADYDALELPDGGAAHLCGHDGHAATLCAVALALEGKVVGKNVFLLFQPAEEIGGGAAPCCEIFQKESISAIYGMHNLPGYPFGKVFTRPGTFACASRGMILRFGGRATHAAYPENGLSPAPAVGKLLCALDALSRPELYRGMTLCTVIGVQMGEKAFGAAASDAEIWLTLRGEHDDDLNRLDDAVASHAEALAKEYGLAFAEERTDVFPSTENTPELAEKLLSLTDGELLKAPMRWSEDFGHYLKCVPGVFFGLGAGEDVPQLHTQNYVYPKALLPVATKAFLSILEN